MDEGDASAQHRESGTGSSQRRILATARAGNGRGTTRYTEATTVSNCSAQQFIGTDETGPSIECNSDGGAVDNAGQEES